MKSRDRLGPVFQVRPARELSFYGPADGIVLVRGHPLAVTFVHWRLVFGGPATLNERATLNAEVRENTGACSLASPRRRAALRAWLELAKFVFDHRKARLQTVEQGMGDLGKDRDHPACYRSSRGASSRETPGPLVDNDDGASTAFLDVRFRGFVECEHRRDHAPKIVLIRPGVWTTEHGVEDVRDAVAEAEGGHLLPSRGFGFRPAVLAEYQRTSSPAKGIDTPSAINIRPGGVLREHLGHFSLCFGRHLRKHRHDRFRGLQWGGHDDDRLHRPRRSLQVVRKTPTMMRTFFSRLGVSGVVLCSIVSCGGTASNTAPTVPASTSGPNTVQAKANTEGATPDDVASGDRESLAVLSREAEQIFGAFGNGMPRLSRDGKTLLFRSNRDGLPQVYVAQSNGPQSVPRRLLETQERISFLEMLPGSDTVIFSSDKGADENFSVFSVNVDGSKFRELTSGETLQRDKPLFARAQTGVVFFSARDKKETTTRVYTVKVDGSEKPRLAYTDKGSGELIAVSPDGSTGLFRRFTSLSQQDLVRVDLANGANQVVYPPSGQAAIHDVKVLHDGKLCLVATDGGSEADLLLKLDCSSGKEMGRYVDEEPKTGAIQEVLLSNSGKTAAILVDAGNRHFVRFVDVLSMKRTRAADLPVGDGALGAFTPDDKALVLRWASPTTPGDIFSVAVDSGKVSTLRADARPGLTGLPELDVNIESVTAHDGLKIPVNTYVPRGAPGKLPVLVMVHGGPAASSTVSYSPLVRFYTAHGFAVVEPNIRGSTGFGRAYEQADDGAKRLDALKDVEAVAQWTKGRAWADPTRLAIWGGSYGGYMVLMGMTRQTDIWRAGVDLVGPSNWRSFMATTTGQIREILSKEFGSVEKDGAFLDSISPLRDIDKVKNPLFVFQGKNDPRVPQSESDQIVVSLRKRGIPVEYIVAPDEGHSLDRRPNQVAFAARTTLFLKKHLGMK